MVTPGTNVKRYLAGSLHWRTANCWSAPGTRRNPTLFVRTSTTCGDGCGAIDGFT